MTKSKSARQTKADSSKDKSDASQDIQNDVATSTIPQRLQQHVLNIFKDACAAPLGDNVQPAIQEVKQHLYYRDFVTAFGRPDYLWAYAARWSPPRALAYLQIFSDISEHIIEGPTPARQRPTQRHESASDAQPPEDPVIELERPLPAAKEIELPNFTIVLPPAYSADETVPKYEEPPAYGSNSDAAPDNSLSPPNFRIASLGGGAGAELVAAAAWLRLQSEAAESPDHYTGTVPIEPHSLEVCCVDIATWESVIAQLDEAIKGPLTISKYASAAVKTSNVALLPADAMKVESVQRDLLDTDLDCLRSLCQRSDLITCMFTLNELYSTSVSKTQRLLFEITVSTAPGALLLVVDSPGSYSTVTLNGAEKRYPMAWLLDHTLLEASRNTRILPKGDHWVKVLTDESRWFRMPKGLEYPIELENMRYQIHLYRRLGNSGEAKPKPESATAQ